jgi:alanine racemase
MYTLAEIQLNNLVFNLEQIRAKVSPAEVIAVVKADAYGHGALPVAKKLIQAGVRTFAVARIAEALELREAGIHQNLLIFGSLFPDEIEIAVQHDVQLSVTDLQDIDRIQQIAARLNQTAKIHLNVDTGMGRVGVRYEQALEALEQIKLLPQLELSGIYTHFATSDEADKAYAYLQLERFNEVLAELPGLDIPRPLIHAANSGAILDLPRAHFDAVRAGISLYGHYPSVETTESIPLRQVMTLKTHVGLLRRLSPNTPVSYGRRYLTPGPTTIAILPIGYADGILRAFTNRGEVQIRGKRYPIVGTVTMDQVMVDVGDDPVQIGDEVVFWGDTPEGSLQCTLVAARIGTIAYELCCAVSRRVPRVYFDEVL